MQGESWHSNNFLLENQSLDWVSSKILLLHHLSHICMNTYAHVLSYSQTVSLMYV